MNPVVGQIWREDDNRRERYVLLTHVWPDVAVIITCNADGTPLPRCKHTNAKLSRFGKAKGYKFVKVASQGDAGTEPKPRTMAAKPDSVQMAPGSYVRSEDGAIMIEVDAHRAVNHDAAVKLGLIGRYKW